MMEPSCRHEGSSHDASEYLSSRGFFSSQRDHVCLVVIEYDQAVHGKDHPEEEQEECDLLQHCSNYILMLADN